MQDMGMENDIMNIFFSNFSSKFQLKFDEFFVFMYFHVTFDWYLIPSESNGMILLGANVAIAHTGGLSPLAVESLHSRHS